MARVISLRSRIWLLSGHSWQIVRPVDLWVLGLARALRHSGHAFVRTSGAQLHIGETRDSGFAAAYWMPRFRGA